jgi:hypothetical protein
MRWELSSSPQKNEFLGQDNGGERIWSMNDLQE